MINGAILASVVQCIDESLRPAMNDSSASLTQLEDAPAWDEAFLRVESYLRAHHIESRVALNALSSDIIAAAKETLNEQPALPPVARAMRITHARMEAWFRMVLNDENLASDKLRARGRLALVLNEKIESRSSQFFLSTESPPNQMAEALRDSFVLAGPEIRFSNMPPAPLEFSGDSLEPSWPKLNRTVFYRAAALWLVVTGAMGVAWATSR